MNAILQDVKPVVWVKWKNREPNTSPLPRNGHTLTQFNGKFLLFGGIANGLDDPNSKKVSPVNDMWQFEIYPKNNYGWSKLSPRGNVPSPRANHTATTVKKNGRDDFIFFFGGAGEDGKLNDCFRYDHSEQKFTKYDIVEKAEKKDEKEPTKYLCPCPRAGHSAVSHNGKVYMFGGNGG